MGYSLNFGFDPSVYEDFCVADFRLEGLYFFLPALDSGSFQFLFLKVFRCRLADFSFPDEKAL